MRIAQDEASRYDRLVLEWGPETQELVGRSYVTVITDGQLGKYIPSYLANAGFGRIRIVSGSNLDVDERYLWGIPLEGEGRATAYSHALRELNPQVQTQPLTARVDSAFIRDQLKRSRVIIDATNSYESKVWTLESAMLYRIPAISASCDGGSGSLKVYVPGRDEERFLELDEKVAFAMRSYDGKTQDELNSLAWAGTVSEEAKKIVTGIGEPIEGTEYLFAPRPDASVLHGRSAWVIGAGASSNIGTYALCLLGFGSVDIIDPDDIRMHNLPRTPWLTGRIGENKADVLAEQLGMRFPTARIRGIVSEFGGDIGRDTAYDLIADFVDNDYARGLVWIYARDHSIAHLSVGTSFDGWNAALAVPGKTACMMHYYPDLPESARESEEIIRAGCEQTVPSNSWMQSGAAFGALLVPAAFSPEISGEPLNGSLYYGGGNIAAMRTRKVCDCWRDPHAS
jgi:molybdopterin/thiamine biosynthesis adenylyltransferase